MIDLVNKFGGGTIYNEEDLLEGDEKKIYCKCCACMSVSSDFLSWANHRCVRDQIVTKPEDADIIIVLGCQVTDLAILNDLDYLERLIDDYPDKEYYVGGCLTKRFDIPLPDGVKRLDNVRSDRQAISRTDFINYVEPFWVENLGEHEFSDGNLFRNNYPLRIGTGCKGKCTYCTIRTTRGEFYELVPTDYTVVVELNGNTFDTVLIADNPSPTLLELWIRSTTQFNKQISLRNLDPQTVVTMKDTLYSFADKGLLKVLHCPIQSGNENILKDMNRDIKSTLEFIDEICPELKKRGVFLATNIIIDYKDFIDPDGVVIDGVLQPSTLHEIFDYISWNPFWDGDFDIDKAKERFVHYFPWTKRFR